MIFANNKPTSPAIFVTLPKIYIVSFSFSTDVRSRMRLAALDRQKKWPTQQPFWPLTVPPLSLARSYWWMEGNMSSVQDEDGNLSFYILLEQLFASNNAKFNFLKVKYRNFYPRCYKKVSTYFVFRFLLKFQFEIEVMKIFLCKYVYISLGIKQHLPDNHYCAS